MASHKDVLNILWNQPIDECEEDDSIAKRYAVFSFSVELKYEWIFTGLFENELNHYQKFKKMLKILYCK